MAKKTIGKVTFTLKDDWVATVPYDKFDVVMHNDVMYIAKQDVPAGTLTSNTDYWFKSISGSESSITLDTFMSDTSANGVENKAIKKYVDNKAKDHTTIFNNGSYNLISYPYARSSGTHNGIEYVAQEDGTILANGTTNGNNSGWTIKKLPPTALERNKTYRILNTVDNSKTFVFVNLYRNNTYLKTIARTNGTNEFIISSSESFDEIIIGIQISHPQTVTNYVCKPMLVEVAEDGSYPTEYIRGNVKGNLGLTSVTDRLEKKVGYNLIPFPYYHTTRTINGITFTVNSDGRITVNGTATANTHFNVYNQIMLENGKRYAIIENPNGASLSTYDLYVYDATTNKAYGQARPDGNIFTFDSSHNSQVNMVIRSGQTVNNLTFEPMIVEVNADGSYPTEYQKYIPSNEELGNKVGTETLTTTAQNLCGAINEHETNIKNLDSKVGAEGLVTDAQDLSGAINEIMGMLTVKRITVNTSKTTMTIAGNSSSVAHFDIPDGYKVLGLQGIGYGNHNVILSSFNVSGSDFQVWLRNTTASSQTLNSASYVNLLLMKDYGSVLSVEEKSN